MHGDPQSHPGVAGSGGGDGAVCPHLPTPTPASTSPRATGRLLGQSHPCTLAMPSSDYIRGSGCCNREGPSPSCHLPESPVPPAGQSPRLGRPAEHMVNDRPTGQHSTQGDGQVATGGYLPGAEGRGSGDAPHSSPNPRPERASEDKAPDPLPMDRAPPLYSQKTSWPRAICLIKSLLQEGSRAGTLG